MLRQTTIALADGRQLDLLVGGDPGGLPIVIHHGAPGCALLDWSWEQEASQQGLRLVTFCRPGYGKSTRRAGRAVAQIAFDTAEVLQRLGIDRFATWGFGGGGPHALACAALLPGVVAASVISGPAPRAANALDWCRGVDQDRSAELAAAGSADFPALLGSLAPLLEAAGQPTRDSLARGLGSRLSSQDRAILQGPGGDFLARWVLRGLGSPWGAVDDDLALVGGWGFDPAQITVPTQLWQGTEDPMVPSAHASWLAGRIRGAELHLEPGLGHLGVLFRRLPQIHSWLAGRFG